VRARIICMRLLLGVEERRAHQVLLSFAHTQYSYLLHTSPFYHVCRMPIHDDLRSTLQGASLQKVSIDCRHTLGQVNRHAALKDNSIHFVTGDVRLVVTTVAFLWTLQLVTDRDNITSDVFDSWIVKRSQSSLKSTSYDSKATATTGASQLLDRYCAVS
jgi:hypothetical protein